MDETVTDSAAKRHASRNVMFAGPADDFKIDFRFGERTQSNPGDLGQNLRARASGLRPRPGNRACRAYWLLHYGGHDSASLQRTCSRREVEPASCVIGLMRVLGLRTTTGRNDTHPAKLQNDAQKHAVAGLSDAVPIGPMQRTFPGQEDAKN